MFCYNQEPSKAEKWELLFSYQLLHWTSVLTRLSEKGGFVAVSLQTCILLLQHSIILKRAFQFTYNTHLKKVAQDSLCLGFPILHPGSGWAHSWCSPSCSQELPAAQQPQQQSLGTNEGRSYTNHRHLCGLLQPQHYHMGEPRQLTPINHFLEDAGRGRDLGHIYQSQCLRKGKKKRCQHAEDTSKEKE